MHKPTVTWLLTRLGQTCLCTRACTHTHTHLHMSMQVRTCNMTNTQHSVIHQPCAPAAKHLHGHKRLILGQHHRVYRGSMNTFWVAYEIVTSLFLLCGLGLMLYYAFSLQPDEAPTERRCGAHGLRGLCCAAACAQASCGAACVRLLRAAAAC